jgi:hypothetical protein
MTAELQEQQAGTSEKSCLLQFLNRVSEVRILSGAPSSEVIRSEVGTTRVARHVSPSWRGWRFGHSSASPPGSGGGAGGPGGVCLVGGHRVGMGARPAGRSADLYERDHLDEPGVVGGLPAVCTKASGRQRRSAARWVGGQPAAATPELGGPQPRGGAGGGVARAAPARRLVVRGWSTLSRHDLGMTPRTRPAKGWFEALDSCQINRRHWPP